MDSNYEIDFIGNKSSGNADAIAIRWKDEYDDYHICIYDCGTDGQADDMIDLLNKYYFNEVDDENKVIDAVVISHPDEDHINGIKKILETFIVNELYANIPWDYADELVQRSENYNSSDYLTSKLKKKYSSLSEIVDFCEENSIPIYGAIQGTIVCDELEILAPTEEDYINHILNSDKNPLKPIAESFSKTEKFNTDSWDVDNLLEVAETSDENETSVVLYGLRNTSDNYFLLVGDAGVHDLESAFDYAGDEGLNIKYDVKFYQVPHHGGRHNLDTDTMNRLVGDITKRGIESDKTAFISVGKGSDHPRQCIVNAFKRRGVKVYKTAGNTIHHHDGDMPSREGWVSLTQLEFIEEYEDDE